MAYINFNLEGANIKTLKIDGKLNKKVTEFGNFARQAKFEGNWDIDSLSEPLD